MQTNQIINLGRIRGDFPILKKGNLIYLDSSATSLTPKIVIDAMSEYYENYNSNVHRGIYPISQKATEEYELAHKKIAAATELNCCDAPSLSEVFCRLCLIFSLMNTPADSGTLSYFL